MPSSSEAKTCPQTHPLQLGINQSDETLGLVIDYLFYSELPDQQTDNNEFTVVHSAYKTRRRQARINTFALQVTIAGALHLHLHWMAGLR